MVNILLAVAAAIICGILSAFGIGGGSLLMVWMSAVLCLPQKTAQGINLLYFLPTAAAALIFHAKNRLLCWRAIIPAASAGCLCAVLGVFAASGIDTQLLRKLFGGFLILVGLEEIFFKGLKKA